MKQTWILLRDQTLLFFFFAMMAAMLLAPLASDTMLPMVLDYVNHINGIVQAKAALAEGQFPLRVATVEQDGWRYPLYQFYSPTTYWIAAKIYQWITPSSPYVAFKCTIWLALVIGGLFMYRLAYWFVSSKPAAILSSVVYLTAPYNIILINHTGAFNEAIAMGILPLVVYYTLQRFYYPQQNKTLLQTALAWYLLCTIHLLSFLCASCVMGMLLLLLTILRRQWLALFDVIIAYLFGCLLAFWYLAPISILSPYLMASHLYDSLAGFDARAPYLSDLLAPVSSFIHVEREGANGLTNNIALSPPSFGMFALAGVFLCLYALFQRSVLIIEKERYWVPLLLGLFITLFLFIWSPLPIWHIMPASFHVILYSWRLIGQTLWISAILFAVGLTWLFKNKLDHRHVVIGILIILMTEGAWYPVMERNYMESDVLAKHPTMAVNPGMYLMDARNYLPFINVIDSYALDFSDPLNTMAEHPLLLDHPYLLSRGSLIAAQAPYVFVRENIPAGTVLGEAMLTAMVDGNIIATQRLQTGPVKWNIPLSDKKTLLKLKHPSITFHLIHADKLIIPMTQVGLGGFLDAKNLMDADTVKPFCQQQQDKTVCAIDVPDSIRLIELPVLFYPDLLLVTLNGHAVTYQSVLYEGRLITGVTPEPGKKNDITVEFRGLPWANFISGVAWILWVFFLLFILAKRYQHRDTQERLAK